MSTFSIVVLAFDNEEVNLELLKRDLGAFGYDGSVAIKQQAPPEFFVRLIFVFFDRKMQYRVYYANREGMTQSSIARRSRTNNRNRHEGKETHAEQNAQQPTGKKHTDSV